MNVPVPQERVPNAILDRLAEWRSSYREVYAVKINGHWYAYRTLTLGEARTLLGLVRSTSVDIRLYEFTSTSDLQKYMRFAYLRAGLESSLNGPSIAAGLVHKLVETGLDSVMRLDYILSTALLYPDSMSDVQMGEASSLAECIWESTGFSNIDTFAAYLADARTAASTNVDDAITAFVCAALHVTPKEVMALDIAELTRYIAMAELAFGKECPISIKARPRQKSSFTAGQVQMPQMSRKSTIDIDMENAELANFGFANEAIGESATKEIEQTVGQHTARLGRTRARR